MENLKMGDILLFTDGSPWEFLHYSYGKITVRADANLPAKPLFDKDSVCVKPLRPKTELASDTEERNLPLELFTKAPHDYVV